MTSALLHGQPALLRLLAALLATMALLLLLNENGLVLPAGAAELLHEVTHDARHALGVPCH